MLRWWNLFFFIMYDDGFSVGYNDVVIVDRDDLNIMFV